MTELENFDFESISNYKHRAVVQTLLTTDLSFHDIQNTLGVSKALFYYIVRQYLPANFLKIRKNQKELEDLKQNISRSCVEVTFGEENHQEQPSDNDLVTVLSIQQAEEISEKNEPLQSGTETQTELPRLSSEEINVLIRKLTRGQFDIYVYIDGLMKKEQRQALPTLREIRNSFITNSQNHPGRRDIIAARSTWIKIHPEYYENSRYLPSVESTVTPKISSVSVTTTREIRLEVAGANFSWQVSEGEVESSILKVGIS